MGFDNLINSWTILFPLAVLLYYFFRKKYEMETISSTLFWDQAMRETKVSPYLKQLQRNLLFYLQMLALLLFLFILLNPFIHKNQMQSPYTIIIVDTSASMLATNEGKTYFDLHKEQLREFLGTNTGQPITIIATGKEPTILARDETNSATLIDAIHSLSVSYEHEQLSKSIEIARSLSSEMQTEIRIYTDALDRSVLPEGDEQLTWVVNGSTGAKTNVSLQQFGGIQTMEGTDTIVKVVNQSEVELDGELRIANAYSGKIYIHEPFNIEGGQELVLPYKQLPISDGLTAEILVQDDYEVDNFAYLLLGNEELEAMVDSNLHELIKKAFESTGISVTSGMGSELAAAHEHSLIVTNDVSFLENSHQPILLMGRNDLPSENIAGETRNLVDPLFSIVNLNSVYVSALYPPFDEFDTIATVGDQPFIQKSKRGDIIVLSDIAMTDWPLHPSFPLFIWSAIETFSAGTNSLGTFSPNERRAVMGSADGIEIYTASDEYVTTIMDPSNFIAPAQPGIYEAHDGAVQKTFSVQLERTEKGIAEGSSFRLGATNVEETSVVGKKMIGALFLLPLLLLLLAEWEVQRRNGFPN